MSRRFWLLSTLLVLSFKPVEAQTRCVLDTTNPAITHTVIPLHGGSFQGVSQYGSPSQWPFLSFQAHWATPTTNGMPFDDTQLFLNPATSHIHLELCTPYWGEITGPITVPFRLQAFHVKGYFYFNAGPLVRDVVFDGSSQFNHFAGDPMGVVIVTGHFTYDPFIQGGGPNIHSGAPNGWTNFESTAIAVLDNGDSLGATSLSTIWTTLDPTAPLVADFRPDLESIAGISSQPDGGQRAWGSQAVDILVDRLPLLAPFNLSWPLPNARGYMYGGLIGDSTEGEFLLRKDMDLHNGNAGTALAGMPHDGQPGTGVLDPNAIGTGPHKLAFIWRVASGPLGKPSVQVVGNEVATALLVVNVEVGDVPPATTCTDPTAVNFGGPLPCIFPPPLPPPATSCTVTVQGGTVTIAPSTVTHCVLTGIPQ